MKLCFDRVSRRFSSKVGNFRWRNGEALSPKSRDVPDSDELVALLRALLRLLEDDADPAGVHLVVEYAGLQRPRDLPPDEPEV